MRRLMALVALLVLVPSPTMAAPPVAPPPLPVVVPAPPVVDAPSYVLYDSTYGLELAARDADGRRPMASTTKIMTALVVLSRVDLDARVTVSNQATEAGESEIGLWPGEVWTVRQLLTAMGIRSANDAAVALAEHVAGSVEEFVDLMNQEARRLGLVNSSFRNPHGLDDEGHYSSAHDLLTMSLAAMEEPFFAEVVRSEQAVFPPDADGRTRIAEATNKLLGSFEGAIGVKTGYTDDAGLVIVASAEREGRRLYAVVMGSEGDGAHFSDAAALLEYGFDRTLVLRAVATGGPLRMVAAPPSPVVDLLVYLDAAGLVSGQPPAAVPEPPEPLPPPEGPRLPDLGDALSWPGRYWQWLSGDA